MPSFLLFLRAVRLGAVCRRGGARLAIHVHSRSPPMAPSAIWNTLRSRDSRGLSTLIAAGDVDVNETGAVRSPQATQKHTHTVRCRQF